jgi:hypothetical protein
MPAPRTARVTRNPQYQFQLRNRPWQLQPFLIAPVLPGETMKNLLLQARVVTDPIKSPLIGWWCEYFIFYVKHRDLDDRDALVDMMLDPNYVATGLQEAASAEYYHSATSINWAKKCLKRVTEEFFRDEGEVWDANAMGVLPVARINIENWTDSVTLDASFISVDVDVEGPDANTTIQASEVENAMRQWEFLRYNNMTTMSYEDYLASHGVRRDPEVSHKPELIRYIRDWTYPVNVVNAATGAPSSACSWKIAERADKDRFFREPGFIFGVTVTRPKVYRQGQASSAVDYMDDAYGWLPATLQMDPQFSWRKFAALSGPLPATTTAYWADVRDIFLHGDQFINFPLTETDANIIGLPTATMNKRYPATADATELFVTAGTAEYIKQDGVVSLSILGRQSDSSPRVP